MNNGGLKFASIFSPDEIIPQTSLKNRDEVFSALLKILVEQKNIGDVDTAFNALLAREAQMPTIVAPGVAMPHARLDAVENMVLAIATSREGICFSDEKGGLAHLVILILVPKAAPGMYLQAASALAKILNKQNVASRVAELETAEEVWRFFNRGGVKLPDYVCAADIMNQNIIALQETDTLEQAIDMFVKNNLSELPVVDKDGELVGMVSEDELLRVCLPDHILWMEDLSPAINFEPFAEILRNESKTWLADIMSLDYAVIPENAPAIEVAKELRKYPARHVFVLHSKKLVGMISLQDFINKVLRE